MNSELEDVSTWEIFSMDSKALLPLLLHRACFKKGDGKRK